MVKNKFIVLLFILVFFSSLNIKAEETDYEYVYSGTCIEKNGFFFSEDGMVRLVLNIKEQSKLANLEKDKQIQLLNVDLQNCIISKQRELQINKQMYENQLQIKQKTIDAYIANSYWNTAKIVGGVVVGIATGVLIVNTINFFIK